MKIYRFDSDVGKSIDQYNRSRFVISKIAHLFDEGVTRCAYLKNGGVIGYHQATLPQLFLVVRGQGLVRGEGDEGISIRAGQAVFWEQGEWHESGTEKGLTAMIIEARKINPAELMPPV